MTDQNENAFTRELIIAIALFVVGDKIVTISRLILQAYDKIIKDTVSKPEFVLEFSLLAIAVGISAVTWISAIFKKENSQTVIIGVIISSIAGVISISEAAFFAENQGIYGEIPYKAFYFFGIYISLVILPVFLFKATTNRLDFSPLLLASIGLLIGALLAIITRFAIMEIAWHLPVFEEHNKRTNILDKMRFRPETLILLGSVWSLVAFQPHIFKQYKPFQLKPLLWAAAYIFMAGASGYLYSAAIEFEHGDNGFSYQFIATGFALVAIAPAILSLFHSSSLGKGRKAMLNNAAISFSGLTLVAFFTLSTTVSANLTERIFLALCFGVSGAVTVISTHLSVITYRRNLQK